MEIQEMSEKETVEIGFTMYPNFYEVSQKLRDEKERLAFFEAICLYAFYDEVQELPERVDIAFSGIKFNIDANKKKRQSMAEKSKQRWQKWQEKKEDENKENNVCALSDTLSDNAHTLSDTMHKYNLNKENLNKENLNKENLNKENLNKENLNKEKERKENLNDSGTSPIGEGSTADVNLKNTPSLQQKENLKELTPEKKKTGMRAVTDAYEAEWRKAHGGGLVNTEKPLQSEYKAGGPLIARLLQDGLTADQLVTVIEKSFMDRELIPKNGYSLKVMMSDWNVNRILNGSEPRRAGFQQEITSDDRISAGTREMMAEGERTQSDFDRDRKEYELTHPFTPGDEMGWMKNFSEWRKRKEADK